MNCFPLAAFKIFFFVFTYSSLIMIWLGMDFLGLILFGAHRASQTCNFMYFTKFKEFSAVISSKPFPALYPFSPGTETGDKDVRPRVISQVPEDLFIFLNLFPF